MAESDDSDRRSSLRRKTTTRQAFSPQMTQSPGGRHLIVDRAAAASPALVTGFRVASMDTFRDDSQPFLQCPTCKQTGVMEARADDELSQGLAGSVPFCCTHCKLVQFTWSQSASVRRAKRHDGKLRPGPLQKELNLRVVIGAMNIGIGASQFEKLLAIMNIPSIDMSY